MEMISYAVGQVYPGVYPESEGCVLEIAPDGDLWLFIQFPNLTPAEEAAIKSGFEKYSVFESSVDHLACLVWKFPSPVSYVDTPFHVGLYSDDRVQQFLDTPSSHNNALTTFVLDGPIIKMMRTSGLKHEALDALKHILRKQKKIAQENYLKSVGWMYRLNSKQIFQAGKQFKHGSI